MLAVLPGVVALGWATWRVRRELAWLSGLGGGPEGGRAILWLVMATNLALVLVTARPIAAWYLLPLYSAIPCWLGELLAALARRSRVLAGLALAGLLGLGLVTAWSDTAGRIPPSARRWAPLQQKVAPIFAWLDARGAHGLYWQGFDLRLPPFELTFLSGGHVVAADPWREEVVAHSDEVDAAVAPPFAVLAEAPEVESLREGLGALNLTVREGDLGMARIFEATPAFVGGFEPLAPDGMTITASVNSSMAANLLDRDVSTGWTSGSPQVPGQWLAVDLGRDETVTRVDLLSLDWQEVPAGYRVDVSRDGARWQPVAAVSAYWGPLFFSEQHALLKIRRGRVQAIFAPVRAHFVRVVQTGWGAHRPWMARELVVYRPGPRRPTPPPEGRLAAALAREGVWFVYGNHWLSARVRAESRGAIGALGADHNLNAYGGRTRPPPEESGASRLEPGVGILVGSEADPEGIREVLRGQSAHWRELAVGPYPLFVISGRDARPRRLSHRGWTATVQIDGGAPLLPLGRGGGPPWVVPGPVGSAASLTLDLGRPRRLTGVQVTPGTERRAATDYALEGSADGGTWAALGPVRWAGRIYWDGTGFLREGTRAWRVSFAPVELRFLRIRRIRPDRAGPAEGGVTTVDCFE